MKKGILALALALLLAAPLGVQAAPATQAQQLRHPVEQLKGDVWAESTQDEKLAFIYGIDMAVAIEHLIAHEGAPNAKKGGKKAVTTLSPFEKGWAKAFKGMNREVIVAKVDDWYKANKDKTNRPVMEVIWFEAVEPQLKALGQ